MAINFPDSPTLNQVFTSGGTSWKWNGTTWVLINGTNLVTTADLSTALISAKISYSSTPPSTTTVGVYYVDSDENLMYVYTGELNGWRSVGSVFVPESDQNIIANQVFG